MPIQRPPTPSVHRHNIPDDCRVQVKSVPEVSTTSILWKSWQRDGRREYLRTSPDHRETGDGSFLASRRISAVLAIAVEVPPTETTEGQLSAIPVTYRA